MPEPSDRLRQLRIKKGYASSSDAARAYGWNENTYKSHENGERGIKLAVARKYAAALGSTASYILTGDVQPMLTMEQVASVRVEGAVAAGTFRPNNWQPRDETAVPALTRKGVPVTKQYAVRVDGPSVNLRIADGMYAICALFDSYPGGAALGSLVHVIRERGDEVEHTIKEIRYTKDGTVLMPVSDHPDHQEQIKLDAGDDSVVRIHGVVIGVFQPF